MCYYNPLDPFDPVNPNNYEFYNHVPGRTPGDEDDEFARQVAAGAKAVIVAIVIMTVFCMLFPACSTPRAVEEHHHHHYEADTAAVSRQVGQQLTRWHSEMTEYMNQRLEQFTSQQQQTEQQHETVTETVTETVDSLGRKVRQEQRTISRDLTREMLQQEQRITSEYESRLQTVTDSLSNVWQQRYDSLAARVMQTDSTSVKKTPVAGALTLWQRARLWFSRLVLVALAVAAVAVVLFLYRKRYWFRLWKN